MLVLVVAIAGSLAFAHRPPAQAPASGGGPPVQTAEIAALYAQSQRLASDTDRISLGIAQIRLNASAGSSPHDPLPR